MSAANSPSDNTITIACTPPPLAIATSATTLKSRKRVAHITSNHTLMPPSMRRLIHPTAFVVHITTKPKHKSPKGVALIACRHSQPRVVVLTNTHLNNPDHAKVGQQGMGPPLLQCVEVLTHWALIVTAVRLLRLR
ncbi:hypothetical protein BDN70DRAFT_894639 [Pholiota conissans]|uniref:Uncharacterized protein n=1 Tax=Pholiota conissans TaxID=109636 RepID=A0A9P6D118_9AGAR|nr:hypothetical protein BDN70DRAFT_894639 [Pholiota conissans]